MPRRFALACLLILVPALAVAQGKKQAKPGPPNWISTPREASQSPRVFFRKPVNSSGVASARLFLAAGDRVTVFVDGEQVLVHDDPTKPAFVDLSKPLDLDAKQKQHVLALVVENESGPAGLLAKLEFDSGWRDSWTIVSDESWKTATAADRGWKQVGFDDSKWSDARVVAALGAGPFAKTINEAALAAAAPLKQPQATSPESMKVAKGFEVELLYSVPKDEQGSWVNMCPDPKGRLYVSDQYGRLYRVTPPGILGAKDLKVEPVPADIGEAQGLLWAFDSLYVCVNRTKQYPGGLYRVTDSDGDDQLDTVKSLRVLGGRGEHGPHAVLLHPDGENIVVVCGNLTPLTKIDTSRVPQTWDEDRLLPRPQGRFMRGTRAPGGFICKTDPNGEKWELIASGFRNQFDAAYNTEGELFTYDADMEWDLNTPWYRPTRICHVVSGAEFGWRSGGGKWPVHFEDSVPPVVNIGPGSPTGVCFGYGAKFPTKYQQALFAADWSYGKLYAVHLDADGASYTGKPEEFITGIPLPLTDVIVNPQDGAMYFLIGGRKVQSGLYRVTFPGDRTDLPVANAGADARKTRRELETHHLGGDETTVAKAWPHLGSEDRFVRYAARIAIEHRPREEWMQKAFDEKDPQAALTALMGLARTFERKEKGKEPDIDSPAPDWATVDPDADLERARVRREILASIDELDWKQLSTQQKHTLLRVLTLTFVRVAPPDEQEREEMVRRVEEAFHARDPDVNVGLARLMVYLQAPYAAEKLVPALENAATQEQQIDLAATLRHLRTGWTPELRERYFKWYTRALGYGGGASFKLFVDNLKKDAVALLDAETKKSLEPILNAQPPKDPLAVFAGEKREFVKKWTMAELAPLMETKLVARDFENGRKMFAAAACFGCHRFDNRGGAVGPDLTSLSGRFSPRDVLESVLEPSKVVSDQYAAVQIVTLDGKVIVGRIVNLAGDSVRVQTNMLDPGSLVGVDRKQIDEMSQAKSSMMPTGLLDTMNEDEVLDLMAYLLSRGDRSNAMFEKK